MKLDTKKRLIFDFDETIFTLHLPWGIFIEKAYQILKDKDEKLFLDITKSDSRLMSVLNKFILNYPNLKDEIDNWSIEFEDKYLEGYSKNSKAINFIKENKTRFEFFIWSSNTFDAISKVLKQNDLLDIFSNVVTREKVRFLKPEIDGFNLINSQDFKKLEYLFIGDSTYDSEAASKCEIEFIHIDKFI